MSFRFGSIVVIARFFCESGIWLELFVIAIVAVSVRLNLLVIIWLIKALSVASLTRVRMVA
jgi:hypothetical protein